MQSHVSPDKQVVWVEVKGGRRIRILRLGNLERGGDNLNLNRLIYDIVCMWWPFTNDTMTAASMMTLYRNAQSEKWGKYCPIRPLPLDKGHSVTCGYTFCHYLINFSSCPAVLNGSFCPCKFHFWNSYMMTRSLETKVINIAVMMRYMGGHCLPGRQSLLCPLSDRWLPLRHLW